MSDNIQTKVIVETFQTRHRLPIDPVLLFNNRRNKTMIWVIAFGAVVSLVMKTFTVIILPLSVWFMFKMFSKKIIKKYEDQIYAQYINDLVEIGVVDEIVDRMSINHDLERPIFMMHPRLLYYPLKALHEHERTGEMVFPNHDLISGNPTNPNTVTRSAVFSMFRNEDDTAQITLDIVERRYVS